MRFNELVIKQTVAKLIAGKDYRQEIINAINVEFLDFSQILRRLDVPFTFRYNCKKL